MNLIIEKWLLVYVCEHKHNFYVIHFLFLTVFFQGPILNEMPFTLKSE